MQVAKRDVEARPSVQQSKVGGTSDADIQMEYSASEDEENQVHSIGTSEYVYSLGRQLQQLQLSPTMHSDAQHFTHPQASAVITLGAQ